MEMNAFDVIMKKLIWLQINL